MFRRNEASYILLENTSSKVLADASSPIENAVDLIPDNSRILDIGTGSGVLARCLSKKGKKIVIDGIEPNEYAADLSKQYYNKMYRGFAQDFIDDIVESDYDFIVMADVLEHIADPLEFLSSLIKGLSLKTKIILSIPNIAFGAVRLALLNGDFDYVDSGLLERTHLRFFTIKTIKELIDRSGMNINKLFYLRRNIFSSEIDLKRSRFKMFDIMKLLNDDLASVYQFLIVISKERTALEPVYRGRKTSFPDYVKFLVKSFIGAGK